VSDQLSLPYSGRSNATRERSRAAAERAAPALGRRQRETLGWIAAQGENGATDNEYISVLAAMNRNTNGVRARRGELWKRGLVEPKPEGRGGSTVWVITPLGRAVLRGEADL
jgi:hypothetical protein